MKKNILAFLVWAVALGCAAQEPFRAKLRNDELNLNLVIDLYNETIDVPGMGMFGPQYGYMNSGIYGTWVVTSCKVLDGRSATANFSNDAGSETQKVLITIQADSTYLLKHTNATCMKKVAGKKLVKLPSEMVFRRVGVPAQAKKTTSE